ncbi:MAG: ComEC/Rec2 family competence protein [Rikenellaceae bacterium]|nr:ComEC/Rec2 family competence protein [Rikenellaceae bacterium]
MVMSPEFESISRKANAMPVVWVTVSYVVGLVAGLWSLLLLCVLMFSRLRALWVYLIPCVGGVAVSLLNVETGRLPDEGLSRMVAVVQRQIGEGCYQVDVRAVSGNADVLDMTRVTQCHVRAAALFDRGTPTFLVGDTLVFTAGVMELSALKVSSGSRLGGLYKRGIRQLLTVYDDYAILRAPACGGILRWASRLRGRLLGHLDSSLLSKQDKAVLSAMLLGAKEGLDDVTKRRYRCGGISHVMAISGLHVGVIYMMAAFALAFLRRFRCGRIVHSALVVLLLWCYAIVSGLSPSVLRAVVMFSLLALRGGASPFDTQRYDALFGSALLLLAVNPALVYDVGFQLSYLSVLAILFFVPKIKTLMPTWLFAVRPVRVLSLAVVVTVTVQLFTLPLTLYYFGTVSVVAVVNNVVVALLATLLLMVGVTYLFTGFEVCDTIMVLIFRVINKFLDITLGLPVPCVGGIEFPLWGCAAVFAVVLFAMLQVEVAWLRRSYTVGR